MAFVGKKAFPPLSSFTETSGRAADETGEGARGTCGRRHGMTQEFTYSPVTPAVVERLSAIVGQ
ncbi:MAG TPA: hypothetical protein VM487_00690, partial [Phycisphaerae bacterium]|nr:hypothetical protein [Phycisphaerae bacterium]